MRPPGIRDDEGDEDEDESADSLSRRRNHLAHLIKSTKLAVRVESDGTWNYKREPIPDSKPIE